MYLGLGLCCYKLILDIFAFCALNDIMSSFFLYEYGIHFELYQYFKSWLGTAFLYTIFIFYESKQQQCRISDCMILLFILMFVVPTFTFYGAGLVKELFYNFIVFIVIFIISFYILRSIKINLNVNDKRKYIIFVTISCLNIFLLMYIFVIYGHGEFYNFFSQGLNVYDKRLWFSMISSAFPQVINYLLANLKIVEIIIIIYLLQKKSKWLMLAMFCILYMHFSLAAEKTVLFSGLIVIAVYLLRKHINLFNVVILMCIFGIIGILDTGLWYYGIIKVPWISSLWRRALFEPVYLTQCYYDYFSNLGIHPLDFMEFIKNRGAVAQHISNTYLFSPNGSANNGMLGGAVAEFGYLGIFITPFILAIVVKLFDAVTVGKNPYIFMPLLIYIIFAFVNSMVTTVLLTHGVIMALLMLWCLPDIEI